MRMRETEFRGKRIDIDNGEWVFGSLCQAGKETYIVYDNDFYVSEHYHDEVLMSDRFFEVDPATVGQFTGLKDKNGKEIYEGDIVYAYGGEYCYGTYEFTATIEIKDFYDYVAIAEYEYREVTGNIYEKPELLEGKK